MTDLAIVGQMVYFSAILILNMFSVKAIIKRLHEGPAPVVSEIAMDICFQPNL